MNTANAKLTDLTVDTTKTIIDNNQEEAEADVTQSKAIKAYLAFEKKYYKVFQRLADS